MSIENFFTLQTQILPNPGQNIAPESSKPGPAQIQGLGVFDFILAQFTETSDEVTHRNSQDHTPLESDNPLLDKAPSLNLAELVAENPEIKKDVEEFIEATGLGPDTELSQVLALNAQAFDEKIKPILNRIVTEIQATEGVTPVIQNPFFSATEESNFTNKINFIRSKLESFSQNNNDGELTVTNLSPQEISILKNLPESSDFEAVLQDAGLPEASIEKLAAILTTLAEPKVDGAEVVVTETGAQTENSETDIDPLLQNLLAIFAPPVTQQQQGVKQGQPIDTTLPEQASQRAQDQINILASRLNSLNTGGGEQTFTIEDYESLQQQIQNAAKDGKPAQNNFENVLKNTAPAATPADGSVLPPGLFALSSSALSTFELSPALIEEYGLNTATSQTSLNALTNLVTQSQSATHAHPATQLVAVNIQKMAGSGENRQLSLQLDPPELGRVQVDMKFGADKSVKAVLTIEKPETYMMMQRDAQTLERALQEAGLDTGDGLNFELAEQGFDFEQNNQRGGGHDEGGTGSGENNAPEEIIESTMTWHIDPESGHTRYDILA